MNSRERWTVYPLLFLAIGLALRAVAVPPDKLSVSVVEAGRIVCGEIVIAAEDDTKLVHVGRVKGGGGGRIEVNDGTGIVAEPPRKLRETRDPSKTEIHPERLELPTLGSEDRCSIQLSYGCLTPIVTVLLIGQPDGGETRWRPGCPGAGVVYL